MKMSKFVKGGLVLHWLPAAIVRQDLHPLPALLTAARSMFLAVPDR